MIRIVAESGVEAVTHRRVAQEAELPLASTTYWFASKDAMLTAALELAAERDIARLQCCAADPAVGADARHEIPDAILALIFDPLSDELRHSRGSVLGAYALWLEAARRPALRERARTWTEAYVSATAALLERGRSSSAAKDARVLIGAVDGLVMQQLIEGERASIRDDLRRLIDSMLATP